MRFLARLRQALFGSPHGAAIEPPVDDRAALGRRAATLDLLAQMRAERAAGKGPARATPPSIARAQSPAGRAQAFRLAIDDAGEFLVLFGEGLVIGHASAPAVDLGLLAQVEREHARLVHTVDFHAGPGWRLVPLGSSVAMVDAHALGGDGAVLRDGARVVLGTNASFRFHACDPESSSAVLELERGLECRGAGQVLLFVPGADGRVTIGRSSRYLVPLASLDHDVTLAIATAANGASELRVGCAGGLARGRRPGAHDPRELALPLPLAHAERVTCASRAADRAPFEIVVAPLEERP